MSSASPSRIFVVDDHPIMRYGLSQLIQAGEDLEVCGDAGSASEAMEQIPGTEAELIIIDITLPDRNGLELLKDLRSLYPDLKILVVSMHDEKLYAERALRAGARGYIMKQEAPGNLVEAVRQVLRGGIFVSPAMSARIVEIFAGAGSGQAGESGVERLTDRELEVFRLIGEGKASREIAGQLNISVRTIDAHRAHIKEKLDLKDSTELVHRAVRWVETGELS